MTGWVSELVPETLVGVYEGHVLKAWIINTMTNTEDLHLDMFNKFFYCVEDSEETARFNLGTMKKPNVIAQSFV